MLLIGRTLSMRRSLVAPLSGAAQWRRSVAPLSGAAQWRRSVAPLSGAAQCDIAIAIYRISLSFAGNELGNAPTA